MATDRQIAANRLNAQASTGPRSAKGKAKSSRNAMWHGITARTALLPGEEEDAFAFWREELIGALDPRDALEFELPERIVSVLWRLRRVPQFEAALLTHLEEAAREKRASEAKSEADWRGMHRRAFHTAPPKEKSPALETPQLLRGQSIVALLTADFSGKLSRYEASLQPQYSVLIEELQEAQGLRDTAPAPRRESLGQPRSGKA